MRTKKNILITGCSSGIGYDAALTLNKRGWRVFASCRSEKDCAHFEELGIESFQLDLGNDESISAAINIIKNKTSSKLNAIFNNAAFAIPGAIQDLPRAALREIFEVNVFGQFDLINRCLPLMQKAEDPRIVNCSSVLGFLSLPYRGAYSATKFALEALTDAMRREIHNNPVKIILLQPGPINTKIRQNSRKHFEKWVGWQDSTHSKIYEDIVIKRLYNETNANHYKNFQLQPRTVTKVLEKALNTKNPKCRYMITPHTLVARILVNTLPTKLLDWVFKI